MTGECLQIPRPAWLADLLHPPTTPYQITKIRYKTLLQIDSHEPGVSMDKYIKLLDDRDIPSPAKNKSGHTITDKESVQLAIFVLLFTFVYDLVCVGDVEEKSLELES